MGRVAADALCPMHCFILVFDLNFFQVGLGSLGFKPSFKKPESKQIFGDHSEEVTPVPIPNTEVKLLSGDGTVALGHGRVARRRIFFFGRGRGSELPRPRPFSFLIFDFRLDVEA